MNYTENNKLIAEFMDWKPTTKMLDTDVDWSILMPVVEAIEATKEAHIHIETNQTVLFYNGETENFYSAGSKLLNTYEAVTEFIKQYNENS